MTEANDPHGLVQMFYNKHSKKRGDVWSSLTDRADAHNHCHSDHCWVDKGGGIR